MHSAYLFRFIEVFWIITCNDRQQIVYDKYEYTTLESPLIWIIEMNYWHFLPLDEKYNQTRFAATR